MCCEQRRDHFIASCQGSVERMCGGEAWKGSTWTRMAGKAANWEEVCARVGVSVGWANGDHNPRTLLSVCLKCTSNGCPQSYIVTLAKRHTRTVPGMWSVGYVVMPKKVSRTSWGGCTALAQNKYFFRHNMALKALFYEILREQDVSTTVVLVSHAKAGVQVRTSRSLVGCTCVCRSSGDASQPGRCKICESCEQESHDHRDELWLQVFFIRSFFESVLSPLRVIPLLFILALQCPLILQFIPRQLSRNETPLLQKSNFRLNKLLQGNLRTNRQRVILPSSQSKMKKEKILYSLTNQHLVILPSMLLGFEYR